MHLGDTQKTPRGGIAAPDWLSGEELSQAIIGAKNLIGLCQDDVKYPEKWTLDFFLVFT
jgi:hypothetical protein